MPNVTWYIASIQYLLGGNSYLRVEVAVSINSYVPAADAMLYSFSDISCSSLIMIIGYYQVYRVFDLM